MRSFEVKVWIKVEAPNERLAEERAEAWLAAMPRHTYMNGYGVEGEGSTVEVEHEEFGWTCQHGTVRFGYATPTASCDKRAISECVWVKANA